MITYWSEGIETVTVLSLTGEITEQKTSDFLLVRKSLYHEWDKS